MMLVLQNTVLRKTPFGGFFVFSGWWGILKRCTSRGERCTHIGQCFGARIRFPHGAQSLKNANCFAFFSRIASRSHVVSADTTDEVGSRPRLGD